MLDELTGYDVSMFDESAGDSASMLDKFDSPDA